MSNLSNYKNRNYIVEDAVLKIRKILEEGNLQIDASTSGLATEATLQLVNNALQLLSATVNNDNQNVVVRFDKDGNIVDVKEDTVTPSNNAPLPVKITSTSGDINITAGDLNVQLSHTGSNFDSIRIGDGTNLLSINADGSLNVVVKEENRLSRYNISREDTSTSTEYYGFVATDGSWYIMQVNTTNGEYKYVNGSSDFLTNWNNRTTLTYDEYNNLTW